MKLDSEAQRKRILELIGSVPVQTNIATLLKGGDDELVTLMTAIKEAEIEPQLEVDPDDDDELEPEKEKQRAAES